MIHTKSDTTLIQLIRIAALLWLGYLIVMALLDRFVIMGVAFAPIYYVANGVYALCFLCTAYLFRTHYIHEKAFGVAVVSFMAALPIITTHLILHLLPRGPTLMVEGMALRLLPVLFIALILIAWQFRWSRVLVFSLGTAVLNFILLWLDRPATSRDLQAPILVTVIQTVSLLTIGYFVSQLISRLHAQQRSLSEANDRLAHYASTLEQLTISRERNRIARELHDTLAHTLSGLTVQLETVKAYWGVNPQASFELLEQSLSATRSGLDETRRALKAIRASPLDDLGLALAVSQVAQEAAARANLVLDLIVPERLRPLPPDVEQCIYRTAQESIANVMHHANAKHLALHLVQQDERTTLTVKDDGAGFSVKTAERPGHFGLTGMQERAQLVGGTVTISSQPGQGTTIQLTV